MYSCQPFPYTWKICEVTEITQGCFSQLGLLGLAKGQLIKELTFTEPFLLFFLTYFYFFFSFSSFPITCVFFFQTLNLNAEFGYIVFL